MCILHALHAADRDFPATLATVSLPFPKEKYECGGVEGLL